MTAGHVVWGLQPSRPARVAWGARAIFKRGEIDLLWDRQSCNGLSKREQKKHLEAVNAWLPEVRTIVRRAWVQGQLDPRKPNRLLLLDEDGFVAEADTKGSHGYLYLVAYEEDVKR